MKDSTSNHGDQARWNAFLIQSVSDADIPTLRNHVRAALRAPDQAQAQARLPGDAPDNKPCEAPRSTQARLLALYIERAREQQSAAGQAARTRARAALDAISDQLSERAEPPPPPPAPEPSPEPIPEPDPIAAAPVVPDPGDASVGNAIRLTYRMVLNRGAADEEVQIWLRNFQSGVAFHEFLLAIHDGPEARAQRAGAEAGEKTCPGSDDGDFVVDLFRVIRGRGCSAHEVDLLRARLESGNITRQGLLAEAFSEIAAREREAAPQVLHDGLSAAIMGTGTVVTLENWQTRAQDTQALARARADLRPTTPFVWPTEPGIRVSAIASLYCGGDFVEQFMDNITGQTSFDRHCELIIIDAQSPENEAETINRYLGKHPSVVYRRMTSRIGIYEAWNVGVEMSRGRYLTNTNLDDLRREDSLEIQAGALDAMPFADVIYQDFYTTFDPALSWEEVAAFGYKSDLPVLTAHNMLHFNSPHNAPMWRKSLHDELGLFDASFKSAGDFEFWMRCLAAGKTFLKVNEPHVVYYQNPQGLSTRADSRGLVESHMITRKYGPPLMARAMTCDYDTFLNDMGTPEPRDDRNRYVTAQAGLRDLARRFKGGDQ